MPKYKREFVNGEIYHVVLRRMGNELLFGDIDDYYRGIFYLYECNTSEKIILRQRRKARNRLKKLLKEKTNIGQTVVNALSRQGEPLVEIFAFCLLPNHIHLLLRQLKENGISRFVQKISSGYAAYFKKKYKIKLRGHFFQDRFAAVHVQDEDQLRIVFTYIHTNPLFLLTPDWKEKGIKEVEKAIRFLEEYKWSSYQDFLGRKNFPSVTERKFLLKIMRDKEGCKSWVDNWIRFKGRVREALENFSSLFLES